jgi:hypothetical protein
LKIVVASSVSPFNNRGRPEVFRGLAENLLRVGHQVEEIWLPFDDDPERVVEQLLAVRLTDIRDAGELLICRRSPSHLLEHPNKVVWFEDLGDDSGQLGADATATARAFAQARRVFSTSVAVSERLRRWLGVETEVLHPPLGDPQLGISWDAVVGRLLG